MCAGSVNACPEAGPVNMLGLEKQVSMRSVCGSTQTVVCCVARAPAGAQLLASLQLPIGLIPGLLPNSTAGLLEWCVHLLQGFACVLHNLRGLAAARGFTNRAAMGCGRVGRGLAGLGGFESVSVLCWQRTGCAGCRKRFVQVALCVRGTYVSVVHRTTHNGAGSLCAEPTDPVRVS